ncbi:MAG: hypothetical protein CENE_02637 [Candidatus Celerinatantimonas neptuna]|nr:MAG: hypothetical protein CENE_02637 [Candidatus Celerinatantimonas neptuna]
MSIQFLASYDKLGNTFPVAAKSVAGRGNPNFNRRDNASLLMLVFYCVRFSTSKNYGGLGEAASAGRLLLSGISTLVQFTTSRAWKLFGGDSDHQQEAIMPNTVSLNQVVSSLRVDHNRAYVTSNELAKVFGKEHKHVLRDIESLDCSDEFRESNFGLSKYKAGTRQYKNYHITRDGFAFLAMGFTGKKAAQFKEAYIQAFNQMEKRLVSNTNKLPSHDPIDSVDFARQRWFVEVQNGVVTNKRLLNTDEYLFNRKQFISFFKEPGVGFNQIDQLMELSQAVNERLVKLVQLEGKQ